MLSRVYLVLAMAILVFAMLKTPNSQN